MNSTPWAVSTVGEQFDVQLGKMLDAANNVGIPKPYLGNRAVQWGRINVSASGVVPLTHSDLQRYRLQYGDLLVCEGGEVGRSAIWRNELPECYYQKALHRLRAKNGYDVRLMLALLEYWSSTGVFANFVTKTSIAHLPREKLIHMPLPLPTQAEQRRISDAIQDIDDLIVTLERLIAKKQAIKQGMMQQLLTGHTRLPGFKDKWITTTFGQLGVILKGRGIKRDDVRTVGTPCIRYGELYTGFVNYTASTRSFVDREVASTALPIRSGDLLFAGSGETRTEIGMCVAYIGDEPAVAGGDILVLRGNAFNSIYLATLANTPVVANQKARAGQGDAVVHINSRALAAISVSLPPRPEQDAIAKVLVDADQELQSLHERLRKARAIKTGMMQQLLTGRTRLPVESDG